MQETSSKPCGCDEGARHVCEWHQAANRIVFTPPGAQSLPADPAINRELIVSGREDLRTITTPPTASVVRKTYPVATGLVDYFPRALMEIAHVSYQGNEQHNPGKPVHWDRSKSGDEADALMRHFIQRGTLDTDGLRHTAKVAWRALAMLEKELEQEASCSSM